MNILKCTDRVKITLPDTLVSVVIAPLTTSQKIEIASKMKMVKGEEVPDFQAQALLCIKYCVKDVENFKNYDQTPYVLEKEGEHLTDSCADDIMTALSECDLILPLTLAANKSISKIQNVMVEVIPKK